MNRSRTRLLVAFLLVALTKPNPVITINPLVIAAINKSSNINAFKLIESIEPLKLSDLIKPMFIKY